MMKMKSFFVVVGLMVALSPAVTAQATQEQPTQEKATQEELEMTAKLQFSTMLMGTISNFTSIKGAKTGEDDNYVYYESDHMLGSKSMTVLNNRKDTTEWFCFVRYNIETDLAEIPTIENGVFGMLNMLIQGGKITGSENTEDKVTTTNLYAAKDNTWMGELVTDGNKKTFHIMMKNVKWR